MQNENSTTKYIYIILYICIYIFTYIKDFIQLLQMHRAKSFIQPIVAIPDNKNPRTCFFDLQNWIVTNQAFTTLLPQVLSIERTLMKDPESIESSPSDRGYMQTTKSSVRRRERSCGPCRRLFFRIASHGDLAISPGLDGGPESPETCDVFEGHGPWTMAHKNGWLAHKKWWFPRANTAIYKILQVPEGNQGIFCKWFNLGIGSPIQCPSFFSDAGFHLGWRSRGSWFQYLVARWIHDDPCFQEGPGGWHNSLATRIPMNWFKELCFHWG